MRPISMVLVWVVVVYGTSSAWADISQWIGEFRIDAPPGAGGSFGRTVDGVGDFNADGYDDVIVGAPWANGAQGAAYVVFGGAPLASAPAPLALDVPPGAMSFGYALAGIGDFNDDGYPDVAVSSVTTIYSEVRIYFGGPGATGLADIEIPVANFDLSSGFGRALAGGDVDGDGIADLLVGAPYSSSDRGRVWVYRGRATGPLPTLDWDMVVEGNPWDRAGEVIAYLGDDDADGFGDFVTGGLGDVVIWRGRSTTPVAGLTLYNGPVSALATGDSNGDGFRDILLGSGGAWSTAMARHYLAGPVLDDQADRVWTEVDSALGAAVALVDIDSTGTALPVLGAPYFDYPSVTGRVTMWFPGQGGAVFSAVGEVTDMLGNSMANVGDVNGDGHADLAVGALGGGYVQLYLGYELPTPPPPRFPPEFTETPEGG